MSVAISCVKNIPIPAGKSRACDRISDYVSSPVRLQRGKSDRRIRGGDKQEYLLVWLAYFREERALWAFCDETSW